MKVEVDNTLTAHEVVNLRQLSGWDHDIDEWETCLNQNLVNVTARDVTGEAIGVGFLTGNQRHAEIVDLVVNPDYRGQGIGRQIFQLLTESAQDQNIKYLGLTYDSQTPWLREFYASEGFREISFAMWHKSSVERVS